jgi:hypothetical protein
LKKNQINISLADHKDNIGSLFSVKLDTVRFTNYEVRTLPELRYNFGSKETILKNIDIVAAVPPAIKSATPLIICGCPIDATHIIDFNRDCFFEVMSILKNINIDKGFSDKQEISTPKILDLCRKYGIIENHSIWRQHNIIGCELRNFKYRLYKIFWRFTVYDAIRNEDYSKLRMLIPAVKLENITDNYEILRRAKEWLILHGPINVKLAQTKDGFTLNTEVSDIINACQVYISLLAASISVQGDHNINIKNCAHCGDFFSGHGNKKYCHMCDRRTVWAREQRQKTKKQ